MTALSRSSSERRDYDFLTDESRKAFEQDPARYVGSSSEESRDGRPRKQNCRRLETVTAEPDPIETWEGE
jgi:hypothetical protein